MTAANFSFLEPHSELLYVLASDAERFALDDGDVALFRLRQFGEALAQRLGAALGIRDLRDLSQLELIRELEDRGHISGDVADRFHHLRKAGNDVVHRFRRVSSVDSFLQMARELAVWYHRAVIRDPSFRPPPFVSPRQLRRPREALEGEAQTLRLAIQEVQTQSSEAELARDRLAEVNEALQKQLDTVAADRDAAFDLASEAAQRLRSAEQAFARELDEALANALTTSEIEQAEQHVAFAEAAEQLDLTELETRRLIDQQLREAGWEADTASLTWQSGARPERGRMRAIAEWPAGSGRADYVLFAGLTPLAVVEAKRRNKGVAGAIEQAKRYSRDFELSEDLGAAGGPWGDYQIPFLFSTNGRPYFKQLAAESGVWFLDGRLDTDHPRAVDGWYTPEGLLALVRQEETTANERLDAEPTDYLPLRGYQKDAIAAVEGAIRVGDREVLVAMATGTGKTRTAIGLAYRLLKSRRFRRILFLVDRRALGDQAYEAFEQTRLEGQQSFTDIYDVKRLGDVEPDADTRLHFATIQGVVRRILYSPDDRLAPPPDQYDCIIVDECHRGYNLDRELSEDELSFRNEVDYVSKYTRVLDHFDAAKVGLTATPALHTSELFGRPIYEYSYRRAVIDGWLVDHQPPFQIATELAREGIHWEPGQEVETIDLRTGQLDLFQTPDELAFEIDDFNKRVVTENFNRVVCAELAKHIDPQLPGKTLVFCANDRHADMVVDLLKQAFEARYGSIHDNTVLKITGATDRVDAAIRRYKNERLPAVAVTVDLLTTGIDVPEITNLVFLRRVRSRILFDQMIGRATRLRRDLHGPGEDKEYFRVFDAVGIYDALEPFTEMKPVVADPRVSFAQLVDELWSAPNDQKGVVMDQLIARLRSCRRRLELNQRDAIREAAGLSIDDLIERVATSTPADAVVFFREHRRLAGLLDENPERISAQLIISDHDDRIAEVTRGYGDATKPEDYIDAFGAFLRENLNDIPALLVVTQRPRDLTREQLRELQLLLAENDFTETTLREAWRVARNEDIAATIIGFIRQQALGSPLEPYEARVRRALDRVLAQREWTDPQRRWLERIGRAMLHEVVLDRAVLNGGEFAAQGGHARIDKVFDGGIDDIMANLNEVAWEDETSTA